MVLCPLSASTHVGGREGRRPSMRARRVHTLLDRRSKLYRFLCAPKRTLGESGSTISSSLRVCFCTHFAMAARGGGVTAGSSRADRAMPPSRVVGEPDGRSRPAHVQQVQQQQQQHGARVRKTQSKDVAEEQAMKARAMKLAAEKAAAAAASKEAGLMDSVSQLSNRLFGAGDSSSSSSKRRRRMEERRAYRTVGISAEKTRANERRASGSARTKASSRL